MLTHVHSEFALAVAVALVATVAMATGNGNGQTGWSNGPRARSRAVEAIQTCAIYRSQLKRNLFSCVLYMGRIRAEDNVRVGPHSSRAE